MTTPTLETQTLVQELRETARRNSDWRMIGGSAAAALCGRAADALEAVTAERDHWHAHYEAAQYNLTQVLAERDQAVREREALRELVGRLQREKHDKAVTSNALFSTEHWKHNAGPAWPEEPDDDSYVAFENCQHTDCKLARTTA